MSSPIDASSDVNVSGTLTSSDTPATQRHRRNISELSLERLREVLDYDPETGWLIWRVRLSPRGGPGERAGCVKGGYRRIAIDGRSYTASHLAWFHFHGEPPEDLVDHENLDKDDNRIKNLRDATHSRRGPSHVYNKGKGEAFKWLLDHVQHHGDSCLPWPFAKDSRVGRGQLSYQGRQYWAHRFMCELAYGPAPADKPQAAHSCGNGHKGCVNPRHLLWKSNTENQLDRREHGTVTKSWSAKFTPGRIAELRALRPTMTQMQLAERFSCSLGTVQYYLKYREQRGHEPACSL
jgi:hypothetical protein